MTKLNQAPLVEVVFELHWELMNKKDLQAVQYLYGDLYNEVKTKYKYRESNFPPDVPQEFTINNPVYKYRIDKNGYPLIQIGPGTLSFNTTGRLYEWKTFYEEVKVLLDHFFRLHETGSSKKYFPGLIYLDFFPIDFKENDALSFLNEKFKIKLNQSFFEAQGNIIDLKTGFAWKTECGDLKVDIQKGVLKGKEGLLLKTNIMEGAGFENSKDINNRLVKMHGICSTLFKDILTQNTYNTFK